MNTSDFFNTETKYLTAYYNLLDKHGSDERHTAYLEGHHVFPRFAFGENNTIVYLSYRCHFLAHILLYKHAMSINHPLKMKAFFPLMRMCSATKNQFGKNLNFNRHKFDYFKRLASENLQGENNPFYGKTHTEEVRRHLSDLAKSRVRSETTKAKLSKASLMTWGGEKGAERRKDASKRMSNRIVSEETRAKISTRHLGKKLTQETKDKISASNLGKTLGVPKSAKHAANISKGLTGMKKTAEHVNKINRNPIKIEKAAAKHRGMTRSEEARKNISEACKGRKASNVGTISYHDPSTSKIIRFPKDVDVNTIPSHLVRGMPTRAPKPKMVWFYKPSTLEAVRIEVGVEPPEGFIRGNPNLKRKKQNE